MLSLFIFLTNLWCDWFHYSSDQMCKIWSWQDFSRPIKSATSSMNVFSLITGSDILLSTQIYFSYCENNPEVPVRSIRILFLYHKRNVSQELKCFNSRWVWNVVLDLKSINENYNEITISMEGNVTSCINSWGFFLIKSVAKVHMMWNKLHTISLEFKKKTMILMSKKCLLSH